MDNFKILENTKSLLVKSIFIECIAKEIKRNEKNDPYLDNLVYCENNSYINAAETYLKELKLSSEVKNLEDEDFDFKINEIYLTNPIERAFFKDELYITELLIKKGSYEIIIFQGLIKSIISEIEILKEKILHCDWLKGINILIHHLEKVITKLTNETSTEELNQMALETEAKLEELEINKDILLNKIFKPKEIFTPILSVREVALLLDRLQELHFIPIYTQEAVGILGSILFKRNKKRITDEFRLVSPNPHNKKKDLESLKTHLIRLMNDIDKMIQKTPSESATKKK
jgi:hypothetical protein